MRRNSIWFKAGLLGILLFPFQSCSRHEPPYRLFSENFTWGEYQVEKMLRDRPVMAKYVQKGDKVWNWTVRQFAGEWTKGGIEWDPSDPNPLWDAMYYGADGVNKALVQVSALSALKHFHFGKPKEGPELWCDLVFELCNLQVIEKYGEIKQLADMGKIGEEEYCFRAYLEEELDTRQEVRHFFMDLWVPNCNRLSLYPWDEFMKFDHNVGVPVWTSREFMNNYFSIDYSHPVKRNAFQEDFCYHHEFYKNQYENQVVPLLKKNKISIPTPMTMPDLKKKLSAELPPEGK